MPDQSQGEPKQDAAGNAPRRPETAAPADWMKRRLLLFGMLAANRPVGMSSLARIFRQGARPIGLAALVFALAACSSPIPPQPSGKSANSPSPSASTSAAGNLATVTGTGRFGLSIRKDPGLQADRIATVPDGYQAKVVGGPVTQDGSNWYKVEGPDVSGWASGTYLTISQGTPVASQPSPAKPDATTTPLSGLLSRLNRETNYDVNGSGIFVQPDLKPAVDHLAGSPTAEGLLQKTAKGYLRLTVGHFQVTSEGGEFSTLGHSIKIADSIMQESLDVQSTVLSHELQHASDILIDHESPESPQDCVNLELRAFQTQETVWLELTKPVPPKTRMERELDSLSHVVRTPAFAQQLAKVYAGECGAFHKS